MFVRAFVRLVPALALAVTVGFAGSGAAMAAAPDDRPGVRAVYRTGTIDLADGWRDAVSCVVFDRLETRCFSSHDEADRLLGYDRETDRLRLGGPVLASTVPACASGWFCLYEHINGGGRRLIFSDEYWHHLGDWNFSRQTSSWRNNQGASDPGHLSLHDSSSVYTCGARTYASSMGAYNDRAYAVWG